MRVSFK